MSMKNGLQVETNQQTIKIGAALAGNAADDVPLKPGDTLTILQIPGWGDIGRSATVKGEVKFPGSYGINEGERLSSLMKRVGGFRGTAYPVGAVLERVEVRQMEEKGRQELIRRIETSTATISFSPSSTGQDQAAILQALQQQQAQTLNRLRSQPAAGRLVINISSNISEWENTPADIFLRAGDVITIPRKPNFVLAYGQVYNPTAVTYEPGRPASWYLAQAGGPTELAYKKAIYVIRANGSVLSSQGSGWFKGSVLECEVASRRHPGRSGKGPGWIDRMEDCAGDCSTSCESGSCCCGCCSLLDGILISPRSLSLVSILLCCGLLTRNAAAQTTAPQPAATNPSLRPTRMMTVETPIHVRALPKNLLEDQEAFLTSPFRMRSDNLFFIVPAIFASSILVGSDTAMRSSSAQRFKHDQPERPTLPTPEWVLCWAWVEGSSYGDKCPRMSISARLASWPARRPLTPTSILRLSNTLAGRLRPDTGDNRGNFFSGGDSFPSSTSAVSWAAASVIAREYPGTLTQILAYGTAGGVSVARVIGQKHWVSDSLLGSALGWYLGRQIYRARASGHEISPEYWGTFVKSSQDDGRDPGFMGTTYVPLDSWVYPALDRLEALGYLPKYVQAIRPLARLECARLTLQAQESVGYPDVNNESSEVVGQLRQEFALELANLEGASNVGVQLESAYARAIDDHGHAAGG